VDCYKQCLLTSANISSRALNLSTSTNYNYEIGTTIDNLSIDDRLYFARLEQSSTLITPELFSKISKQVDCYPRQAQELPDLEVPERAFLISSLPMSTDINQLTEFYFNKSVENETELNCAIHDLALYDIPFGLSQGVFYTRIKQSFFAHPFIKAFIGKIDERGEIYFGEAKSWIQANCSNVPIPRRWEITENIQILYRWFYQLDSTNYKIDRPSYSERLAKL
jgi:hypothetical protein